MRFTLDRRDAAIEAVRGGASLQQSAADAGVGRTTLVSWLERGRREDGTQAAEFARAFDAARLEIPDAPPLTHDDLIRLLEREARKGVVRAIQLLLERPWHLGPAGDPDPFDEFDLALQAKKEMSHDRRADQVDRRAALGAGR